MFVILYSGLQILESTVLYTPANMEVRVRKTVTRDGVDYYPRQDITTVLVMGIDQTGPVQLSEEPNDGKAVDMDDEGALIVEFSPGYRETVNSGEVSVRGMYGYL